MNRAGVWGVRSCMGCPTFPQWWVQLLGRAGLFLRLELSYRLLRLACHHRQHKVCWTLKGNLGLEAWLARRLCWTCNPLLVYVLVNKFILCIKQQGFLAVVFYLGTKQWRQTNMCWCRIHIEVVRVRSVPFLFIVRVDLLISAFRKFSRSVPHLSDQSLLVSWCNLRSTQGRSLLSSSFSGLSKFRGMNLLHVLGNKVRILQSAGSWAVYTAEDIQFMCLREAR